MQVSTAFDLFQTEVNADPAAVTEGRRRRDLFRDGLEPLDDVVKVIPSGSLARHTQLEPIHDVDMIAEFAAVEHPEWGKPGDSAGRSDIRGQPGDGDARRDERHRLP